MTTLTVSKNATMSDLVFGSTASDYDSAVVYGCLMNSQVSYGGDVQVYVGGTASNITLQGDADSGGTLANMGIQGGLSDHNQVMNGGVLSLVKETNSIDQGTSVYQGGIFNVYSTGVSYDSNILGGKQTVYNGGLAIGTTVTSGEQQVWKGGTVSNTLLIDGSIRLENSTALAINLHSVNGTINLGKEAILRNAIMEGGSLNKVGYSAYFTIDSLGMLPGSTATITEASTLTGNFYLSGAMILNGQVHASDAAFRLCLEFLDGTGNSAIVQSSSAQTEAPLFYTTVLGEQPSGVYILASGGSDFLNSLNNLTLFTLELEDTATLSFGEKVSLPTGDFELNIQDGKLQLTVTANTAPYLKATESLLAWANVDTESDYVVEITPDGLEGALTIATTNKHLDLYGAAGTYDIQLQGTVTATLELPEKTGIPKILTSIANDRGDLFFAQPIERWGIRYSAVHAGFAGGWEGTGDRVSLYNRNRFANLFQGSSDSNLLLLTDDAYGDALFAEDAFTALPEGEEQQARLSSIYEIRAGDGNDVVDMTGTSYSYSGESNMIISGGDGHDYLWGGATDCVLFGDNGNDHLIGSAMLDFLCGGSGDDIIHGAGGDDYFFFCQDWGNDKVTQLAGDGNYVTFWFAEGVTLQEYQASDTVITDGVNTVTLQDGLTAGDIRIFCGSAPAPDMYAMMASTGLFSPAYSHKIYDTDAPIITSL